MGSLDRSFTRARRKKWKPPRPVGEVLSERMRATRRFMEKRFLASLHKAQREHVQKTTKPSPRGG